MAHAVALDPALTIFQVKRRKEGRSYPFVLVIEEVFCPHRMDGQCVLSLSLEVLTAPSG